MAIEAYIRQQILINISFDYDLLLIWHNTGQCYWKSTVFALHKSIVYHQFLKWHSHYVSLALNGPQSPGIDLYTVVETNTKYDFCRYT